jgi:tetratricopeptide (TPR) repeat protein
MLIGGYQTQSSWEVFNEVAEWLIFGEGQAAALTFPGAFEMLPLGTECVALEEDGLRLPQNIVSFPFWRDRFAGPIEKFAEKTGLEREAYLERVRVAIEKAERFRGSFDRSQGDDLVYHLFSSRHQIPPSYIATASGDGLEIRPSGAPLIDADGRVAVSSATNDSLRELPSGKAWPLEESHGKLLSDPGFARFLQLELSKIIELARAQEVLAFAAVNTEIADTFRARGLIALPQPDAVSPRLLTTAQKQAIATYNISVFTAANPVALYASPTLLASKIDDEVEDLDTARALYESIAWADPDRVDAATLNRLAVIHLEQNRPEHAQIVLESAAIVARRGSDPQLTPELHANIYRNLAAAFTATGRGEKAERASRRADAIRRGLDDEYEGYFPTDSRLREVLGPAMAERIRLDLRR